MDRIPGLVFCVGIALAAWRLGTFAPLVGGPVFGILIGLVVALVRGNIPARLQPGIKFAGKQVLQLSIVLLGATLQLREVFVNGARSLPVMLGTLVVTLAAAYVFGRLLRIDRDLRRLLGIGTAICGGSAIAALSSVIEVGEADVAYAITTVFLFNIVAVLTFPWIGHALALTQHAFGLWAGTAINDTSSVVAAGFVYGHAAGNEAVIVKLTRTLLILPIVLFYAGKRISQARASAQRVPWRRIMPWFILWFLLAAIIRSAGAIPPAAQNGIAQAAVFLIIVALSGIGLSADAVAIRRAGLRPLALGFILWACIASSSLAIAHYAGLG